MFEINNDVFEVTRGDKGTFTFSIKNYVFKVGDIIKFKIHNKNGLNLPPVLYKEIIVEIEGERVDIHLTSQDTKIGEMLNKKKEYWYEIELNEDQTIKCFDKKGPKLFYLYPEGADKEADANDTN